MMIPSKNVMLVTGSSGLIGSAVCRHFADRYEVVGLDRPGPPHPPEAADSIDFDLASDESVRQALRKTKKRHGSQIATVIHLAAYYDFSGEPSPLYDTITVRGTQRLLDGLRNFEVEQFLFSSTMLVHAPCEPGQRINEDWPLEPKWDYPRSKIEVENIVRHLRRRMSRGVLRIAGVYDDYGHSIPLCHQIQRIYERWMTSYVFPGDTSRGQAFIHLDDLIDALDRLVERRSDLPRYFPLLLGEPETMSYDELQRALGKLIHGEEWTTRQIPKALAKAGAWLQDNLPLTEEPFIKPWMIDLADDHYELDISRAQSLLEWSPQHSLRETLPKIVDALKSDPDAWYREHKLKQPSTFEPTNGEVEHDRPTLVHVER